MQAGTRLGPYEIVSPLGAGGMGEVWRARDTRLERDVAIKVVRPGVASDPDRLSRFEKEARAAAQLDHPNILVVHDVGTHEGSPFIVSELLQGESLREKLGAPLPPKRAVDYAIQIAHGLAAAHEKGIVHRDIKPENVFVTKDGHVKILDFGVAKLLPSFEAAGVDTEKPTATATQPGTAVGTVAYMSPEQIRGQQVDARTDLFSLGVVLYEMLSGKRPFQRETPAEIMTAILHEEPPDLSETNRSIPAALKHVVRHCLEKEPKSRFQSARDVAFDLEALPDVSSSRPAAPMSPAGVWLHRRRAALAGTALLIAATVGVLLWTGRPKAALSFAPRDWILVADVQNETGEPVFDRALFTALTVSLEQSAHANVLPRSRVAAALSRMKRDPASRIDAELGREICVRENVRALVTFTIAGAGGRYLLAARIVDPRTGESVRSFEERARGTDAVLPALSSLAARIRRGLGESLPAIQLANRPLPMVTTASLHALESYAQGQQLWEKGRFDEAVKLYESAVAEDPGFAMAHAALGNAYMSHVFPQPAKGRECYERALQLASRTTDRERLLIQASTANAGGDGEEAARLYRAYLARYPDDIGVRYTFGTILMRLQRSSEALGEFQEVTRTAPSNANAYINMANTLGQLKRYPEALDSYAKAFALEPAWEVSGNLNHEYGFTLVKAGDVAKARDVFAKAVATKDLKAKGLRSLALLDLYEGKYRDAAAHLREAILLNEMAREELSACRDRAYLAAVLEGQGNRAAQLAELDQSKAILEPLKASSIWSARLGVLYARAGRQDRAEGLRKAAAKSVRPADAQEMSYLHRLEGEIELARGRPAAALVKLGLADHEFQSGLTLESLAHGEWSAGNVAEAVRTYETLLATSCLGWEAQQPWVTAHYSLALAYRSAGQREKARAVADRFLALWKDADPDLALRRRVHELRRELDRPSGESSR